MNFKVSILRRIEGKLKVFIKNDHQLDKISLNFPFFFPMEYNKGNSKKEIENNNEKVTGA